MAATLAGNYGIFGPTYEYLYHAPYPGKEEYAFSEKYEIKWWDWEHRNKLTYIITQVNKIRKENLVLTYGKYTLLDKENPDVYAYTRILNGKKMLVLLNFKSTVSKVNVGIDYAKAKLLISNYSTTQTNGLLQPYEAAVYEL